MNVLVMNIDIGTLAHSHVLYDRRRPCLSCSFSLSYRVLHPCSFFLAMRSLAWLSDFFFTKPSLEFGIVFVERVTPPDGKEVGVWLVTEKNDVVLVVVIIIFAIVVIHRLVVGCSGSSTTGDEERERVLSENT